MKRLYSSLLMAFMFIQLGYCQALTKVDTASVLIARGDVVYACLDTFFKPDYYFLKDSMLRDFFQQVDLKGNYDLSNENRNVILAELLKRAKNESSKVCLLPFYRMLDPKANEIYQDNCKISSMWHPFTNYCHELPARYVLLFYIHITQVEQIKVKKGEVIARIQLTRQSLDDSSQLTEADYDLLYKYYFTWLNSSNDSKAKANDPLSKTGFYWDIEVKTISSFRSMGYRIK